ncbi:MAG: phosphoadenosine phosphosulfate reductase [Polyangiaceae bacterium]|jgi:phosphoadenosine phosphosulfate reductase|nr:phosphoadenosine phosphosulfate reductase [Polyangiaceae bacterium]
MHVTMVKKRLKNGQPCEKCVQAEELLKRRGLWEYIDDVVWADENDESSAGMKLAQEKGVTLAPFFIVKDGENEQIYTSALGFIKERLVPAAETVPSSGMVRNLDEAAAQVLAAELVGKGPAEVVERVLRQYGARAAISFSGAEDVMLIDLAAKSGHPFSVFSLDTGRLHSETYRFIERVRKHYGIEITITAPDTVPLEDLVRKKGLFSFYDDGHTECCGIRKVGPLRRVLTRYSAWLTGQRRDQSPTRADVPLVQLDTNQGADGRILKVNPLAEQSLNDVWTYIRDEGVPYNALHDQGFISIGCEPCTRIPRPGEHERAGRWWWEDTTKRECGLHLPNKPA